MRNAVEVPNAVIQLRKAPEGHLQKEEDLEGHLDNDTVAPPPPPAPEAPKDGPAGPEEAGEPEALRDEEEFQLQRALDLLKTWDILHKTRGQSAGLAP